MQWLKVTQNEAVFKGRDSYTAIDKVSKNFFGLALNFTPTWFQVFPGVDILAPITWSQGISGNAAVLLGGNEGGGNWSVGVAADIYQKYRIDLKYIGYFGNYSTDPTTATPAGWRHGCEQRRHFIAVRPRLGFAHVQDHVLRRITIMFRQSLMALAIASLTAGSALAAVSADEAKQLGTTLTRGRRRKGRQQGRHDSRVHGRDQAAGRLQGRRPARRSVRERKAAPVDHRQGRGGARRQADRGHEGAAQALPDDARRRLSDAPHRRAAAAGAGQHAEERDRREDRSKAASPPRTCCPASRSRSRRPATRRCGTTCCATTASATTARSTTTGTSTRPACRRSRRPAKRTWAWPIYDPKKTGAIGATDPYWLVKLTYIGPARRAGEALLSGRLGQSAEAGTPRVAVPAGTAPRQARAGPRLRHAESRRRRRVDLRRRVGVQRRDGPLRLEARRQEGDVHPVRQLPADVPQESGGRHEAEPPQSRTSSAGSCIASGSSRRRSRKARATSTASACSTSTRTAGSRSRPTSTTPRGQLYRSSFAYPSYSYDAQAQFGDTTAIYDFSSGLYNITGLFGPYAGLKYMTELPKESFWSSEALAGAGVR